LVAIVEFHILGSVEVADGGGVKDLGGLRERTLLTRLLLSAGQVVSADRLAEDLWEGQPPPQCMATLRVYVSRLRRALGDALQRLHEAILRQEPGLDWRPAAGRPAPVRPAADAPEPAGETSAKDRGDGNEAGQTTAGTAPGWLPAETTSFIGRESELATIYDLLGLSRLLTLTGPSGSGKTRRAIRAAAQESGRFPGGVWLVELAPVTSSELVTAAVASALGAREEPGQPLADTIAAHLRGGEALLIVDNCEHVLDAAAELIGGLLRRCPSLRVLATSQTRLNVAGEATWPVPPLTRPAARGGGPGGHRRGRVRPDVPRPGGAGPARVLVDRGQRGGGAGDLPSPRRHTARARAGRGAAQRAHRPAARGPARRQVPAAVRRQPDRPAPAPDAAGRDRVEPRPAQRGRAGRSGWG
jgi:hypothetical protein